MHVSGGGRRGIQKKNGRGREGGLQSRKRTMQSYIEVEVKGGEEEQKCSAVATDKQR